MSKIKLDPSQEAAVKMLAGARIGVMTGGPGTGKTTTLRALLDTFDRQGVSYALCAPTGKAAKRMAESTGRHAVTVHRLLEYHPAHGFAYNAETPMEELDVVVVDEASMLDIELFAALTVALDHKGGARILLVGDADQLPSVGPGQVLADLVACPRVPTARLTTLHRAAAESWVCKAAADIVGGKVPSLETRADFDFIECETAAGVQRAALRAMVGDPSAQVLTPQKGGDAGADAINVAVQAEVNPRGANTSGMPVRMGERRAELRAGDRVIQTRNNYELDVFNGEVGSVVSAGAGAALVDYGDRTLEQKGEHAFNLRLAYALTIHKSQGSEWDHVIVVAHSTHSYMLTRQLIYTAITRAKKRVTIIGDRKGIAHAVKRDGKPRNSTLIERMEAGKGEAAA